MTKEGSENNYSVYVHIAPSGKMYVGITKQTPPSKRWAGGSGYKGQVFYNAVKKYGWDNIEHDIIAEHLTKEEAENFEIVLIDKLQTRNPKYGYNVTVGGEGTKGKKYSKEECARKSETAKEIWRQPGYREGHSGKNSSAYGRTGEKHPLYGKRGKDCVASKQVICLNTLKIYDSAGEASKETGVNHSKICMCCRGERKSCGKDEQGNKLVWMYYEDYITSSQEEILKRMDTKTNNVQMKKVVCLTTLDIYDGVCVAGRRVGVDPSGIVSACKGNQRYAGKDKNGNPLHWMYYDDYKNVVELFYGIK